MAYSRDDSSDSSDEDIAAGPSWMNKFSAPVASTNPAAPSRAHTPITNITAGPNASFSEKNSGEPEWMNKFGVNRNGNNFHDSSTSLSSSTHSFRTEEPPAWMNKFKKSGNNQQPMNGSYHNQLAPTSPSRSAPLPPTTTPTTPSWMKQYRKTGGNEAGAPSIPAVPSLGSSNHSTTTTPTWRKSSLNNSNSNIQSHASAVRQGGAPETPSWMAKFDMKRQQINDIPKAPALDDENEHDDNKSAAAAQSFSSSRSINKDAHYDWMQKFSKNVVTQSNNQPPPAVSVSNASHGAEPEWMSKFKQIGMSEENATVKERATVTKIVAPPRPPMNISPDEISQDNVLSTRNLSQSHHNVGANPKGMSSAPTTPRTFRKIVQSAGRITSTGIGVMSAPSSPVVAAGKPKAQLSFHLPRSSTEDGGAQQRRLSVGGATFSTIDPPIKVEDPAAREPQNLDWMDKVKAVANSSEDKPAWMQKLLEKKQGNALPEEKERSNKTPPWKLRERLKEEQAEKLRESLGLDLGVEEGEDDDEGSKGSWASEGESSADEEDLPEWMKQFKKMDLRAARVVTAQGRAPQTVALLRTGSAGMVERTGDIVDDSQVIKAISVRSHSTRSLKMSRHASFKHVKTSNHASKHSKTPDEDASQGSFAEQEDQGNTVPSRSNLTRDLLKPADGPPKRKPSEFVQSKPTSEASMSGKKEESTLDYLSVHSNDTITLSAQIEIDNSAPENVMSKWGKTVKAKKPVNSTLMSWRMIQNQKEKVRERIEQAKRGGVLGEAEGEDCGDVMDGFHESATALFFDRGDKKGDKISESFSMENSAANIFGFGGGKTKNSETASMDNSAAALFGFVGGNALAKKTESVSLENSAANLFGHGGGDANSINSKSISTEKSATASLLRAVAMSHDSEIEPTEKSSEQKMDGHQSLSNFLATSKSGMGSPLVHPTAKTKSIESTGSDLESENDKLDKDCPLTAGQPTSFATTAAVAEPASMGKKTPQPKKKSFLDDSESDSDSDSEDEGGNKLTKKATSAPPSVTSSMKEKTAGAPSPISAPPKRKKSFLDDSDSDDDTGTDQSSMLPSTAKSTPYKPTKTESTTPLVPSRDDDNNASWKAQESSHDNFGCTVSSLKEPEKEADSVDFPSDSLPTAGTSSSAAEWFDEASHSNDAVGFDASDPFGGSEAFGKEPMSDKSEPDPVFLFQLKPKEKSVHSVEDRNNSSKWQTDLNNSAVADGDKKEDTFTSSLTTSKSHHSMSKTYSAENDDFQTGFVGFGIEELKKKEQNEWEAALMDLKTESQEKKKLQLPNMEKEKVLKRDQKRASKNIELLSTSLKGEKKKENKKKDDSKAVKKKDNISGKEKKTSAKDHKKVKKDNSFSSMDKKKDEKASSKRKEDKKKDDLLKAEKKRDSKKEKDKPLSKNSGDKKENSLKSDWKPPKSPKKRDKALDDSKRSWDKSVSLKKDSPKANAMLIMPSKASKKSDLPSKPKSTLMIKPKSFVQPTPSKPKSFVMQPKSRTSSLVIVPPKSKTSLVPTKPKSKKIVATDFDDDNSFVMNDFDDDFSAAYGFGDFGEDGSVLPLKAVRNQSKRSDRNRKDKRKDKNSIKDGSQGGKSKGKGSKGGKSKDKGSDGGEGKSKDKKSDQKSNKKKPKKSKK